MKLSSPTVCAVALGCFCLPSLCLGAPLAPAVGPGRLSAELEREPPTRAMQVVGNHLFVAAWGYGVQVLDISEPARPKWKGGWNPQRCPVGVHVTNGRAYIADRLAGLTVLDVADPARPAMLGNVDTPGDASAVDIAGHYAYVADGPGGLRIANIRAPRQPVLLGHFPIPQRAVSVAVTGHYAWVTEPNGLHVVDVRDPLAPTAVTSLGFSGDPFSQVQFTSDYAFAAGRAGLLGYDLANPSRPILLDGLMARTNNLPIIIRTGPTTSITAGYTWMLTNAAFAKSLENRFSTNAPRDMAEIVENLRRSPFYYQYVQFPRGLRGLHLLGGRALSLTAGSLLVIDMSDPAAPQRIGEYDLGVSTWDVRGEGRFAYVMDNGANIHVLDLGDPARPVVVGRFDSRGYASAALAVRDVERPAIAAPAVPAFQDVPVATNAPVLTDPKRLSDGAFAFTLRAQGGASYVVQTSSDLVTWTALSTNTLPARGALRITDPHAATVPNRCYRAVRQP